MRVLIIRTFPDKLNLKSYNVQEVGLAKALTLKGHVCDIALYNKREADWEQEYKFKHNGKEFGFKIYWLHGYNLFKNGFMPTVKKLFPKYDVIQVHEYDQLMSWQLYSKQIKPTIIYHGPYYDKYAKGYNLKCKLFDTLFLPRRKHDDIVVLSKSTLATELMQKKGFRNVTTVGVGIDLGNFGDNVNSYTEKSKKLRERNLLYVGKLEERRNVYFLVEVFREIHKINSDFKLTIIGNGDKEYKDKFLDYIKDEIDVGDIVYKEKAQQTELVEYYNEASFFLLASNYEIFGMVLLEAMYFGAPVISSVNGGSCTLIQNGYNGFVIDEFEKEAWADCILKSIQNECLLEKMKINARKTIEKGFTWDVLADSFIQAYEYAIAGYEENKNV